MGIQQVLNRYSRGTKSGTSSFADAVVALGSVKKLTGHDGSGPEPDGGTITNFTRKQSLGG